MAKLYTENGEETEAFTAEELAAKQKEAVDKFIADNPDKNEDLTAAQKSLEEAQTKIKELEAAGGSEGQKARLKAEKDAAENNLKTITESLTKEMATLKESIFGGQKNKMLEKLSNGDPELKKKIELEYDSFKGDAANETEIQARLVKAATIVTGNKPQPNFMDSMSSGNGKDNGGAGVAGTETPEQKAQRGLLGISDADATKFTPKTN